MGDGLLALTESDFLAFYTHIVALIEIHLNHYECILFVSYWAIHNASWVACMLTSLICDEHNFLVLFNLHFPLFPSLHNLISTLYNGSVLYDHPLS